MRLSSRKRSEERMELSTTGMIDIVFLLLVFFLATASFLPPEKEIRPAISTEEKSSSASNDLEKAIKITPLYTDPNPFAWDLTIKQEAEKIWQKVMKK